MTPTTVKYLYESGKRVNARHKKRKHKIAEDILAPFFAKIAMSLKMPASPSQSVGKFVSQKGVPGTMPAPRVGKPTLQAPGVKSVKPVDGVINPDISPKNALRKNTPATQPQGLSGVGPMNTGL